MQREILFRGKRVDNGEWVEGYYAYDTEWAKGYILSQQKKGAFFQLGTTEVIAESVGQFTGLLDKNDIKIFEGDILLINYYMGANKEYFTSAYYRVDAATYLGLTQTCLNEDYPSPTNLPIQYPTYNTLSFDNSTLCTDYVNKNYKHICIADRFYNDSRINRRWQENHYSNDITVTGNLIDNPQLLTPCP